MAQSQRSARHRLPGVSDPPPLDFEYGDCQGDRREEKEACLSG